MYYAVQPNQQIQQQPTETQNIAIQTTDKPKQKRTSQIVIRDPMDGTDEVFRGSIGDDPLWPLQAESSPVQVQFADQVAACVGGERETG